MMVNAHSNWKYLWNVMDETTRFQLTSVVSKEYKVRDAPMVFQCAKKISGGRTPKYMVTDGLGAYKCVVNNNSSFVKNASKNRDQRYIFIKVTSDSLS